MPVNVVWGITKSSGIKCKIVYLSFYKVYLMYRIAKKGESISFLKQSRLKCVAGEELSISILLNLYILLIVSPEEGGSVSFLKQFINRGKNVSRGGKGVGTADLFI